MNGNVPHIGSLGPSSVKTKVHFLVVSNTFIAAKDWRESSCNIKIYSILPVDRSVLRNFVSELSYLSKRGEVTRFFLQVSNNEINFGVQEIRGIILR